LVKRERIDAVYFGRWTIYTKPNKQIIIDILMSLYSFFYPAEYAEDVTESDAFAI
jgi:hypothetical protein